MSTSLSSVRHLTQKLVGFDRGITLLFLSVLFVRPSVDQLPLEVGGLNANALLGIALVAGAGAALYKLSQNERGAVLGAISAYSADYRWVVGAFGLWFLTTLPSLAGNVQLGSGTLRLAVWEWGRVAGVLGAYLIGATLARLGVPILVVYRTVIASAIVPLGVGLYQWETSSGLHSAHFGGFNRIFGTLSHPNLFGSFVTLIVLLVIGAWIDGFFTTAGDVPSTLGKMDRWPLLAAIVGVPAIALTGSRTAWGGLALGVGAAAILALLARRITWKSAVGLLVVVALLMGVGMGMETFRQHNYLDENGADARVSSADAGPDLADPVGNRFSEMGTWDQIVSAWKDGQVTNSITWRIVNWKQLMSVDRNVWLGTGLNTTKLVNPWKVADGSGYQAHNEWVRAFVETGWIGLVGHILLFLVVFWRSWRLVVSGWRRGSGHLWGIALALAVMWGYTILDGMLNDPLKNTGEMIAIFGLMGLMHATFQGTEERPSPTGKLG